MNFKNIIKAITSPFVAKYQAWVHQKLVRYSYNGIEVNVLPGVFSPKIHSTTPAFLAYIETLDLNQKTILELGCGSGIISVVAATKGGIVTSSDVNDIALNELTVHARDENLNIIVVYSDLFENLHFHFDYIFINPPALPKAPISIVDMANRAGENFEYFERLFSQLKVRTLRESVVLISLPERAELFSICRRAKLHHLKLETVKVMHQGLDRVVIYRVIQLG
jgi:release factor glutamine methyltransferase